MATPHTDPARERLPLGLLLSLLVHALLFSPTFGGQGTGLPGFGFPWEERRGEAPDRTPAPHPPSSKKPHARQPNAARLSGPKPPAKKPNGQPSTWKPSVWPPRCARRRRSRTPSLHAAIVVEQRPPGPPLWP